MGTRFTYRSLYRDGRDREKQAVWSAAPCSDETAALSAIGQKLEAVDLRVLITGEHEGAAAAYMQGEYPEVARARFEHEALVVRIDEDRRILYVDIDARLVALDADGREIDSTEYDYYARQVVMDALERHVG